jgi:hypothetical protein
LREIEFLGSFCSCRTELDQVLESILVLVGVGAPRSSSPLSQGLLGISQFQETVDASLQPVAAIEDEAHCEGPVGDDEFASLTQ